MNGCASCHPFNYATNTADTTTTLVLATSQFDSSGCSRGGFAPNCNVGDIIEYQAATGGINTWEPGNCDGWIRGDALLPRVDAGGTPLTPAGYQAGMSLIISASGGVNKISADWPRFH
jgi:hypothetical protein